MMAPKLPARKTPILNQLWIRGLGMLILLQQSVYWGYRMGQDECVFKTCPLPHEPQVVASGSERNLDAIPTGPVRRGIVLSSQCSGSEWIISSLNAVPGVTWHLERMSGYSRSFMQDLDWEKVTWVRYKAQLEEAFKPGKAGDPHEGQVTPHDPNEAAPVMIGFKLMYDQIPQQLRLQFAQWLEENQVFVIHLRRKCAALQFASQMDKWMHKYRHQNKKDHVYSKEEAEALARTKDWQITLQDRAGAKNRWLESIRLLEENQQEFANYLHVYAAQAPVFEFTYESVDGPHQANWFNALYAFLGLHHHKYVAASKTIKTGKRTCEDRMVGLGGSELSLLEQTPQSRVECLRMRGLAAAANQTTSLAVLGDLGNLLLPPNDGRCRLGPNCRQREYGRFQDALKQNSNKRQHKSVELKSTRF